MHVGLSGWSYGTSSVFEGRRGFTRQPENSKRAHLWVPAFKNITKIQREDTQERGKKTENGCGRGKKKRAKCWASHPSGPTLRGPPFGATLRGPPFGCPPLLGSGPPPFGFPPFGAPRPCFFVPFVTFCLVPLLCFLSRVSLFILSRMLFFFLSRRPFAYFVPFPFFCPVAFFFLSQHRLYVFLTHASSWDFLP